MNINAVLPFCQFPTLRPVVYEWVLEYVEACSMNGSEYNVLNSILSKVQVRDSNNTWGNNGYCSLSIQSIANTWGISRAIVQRSINTLELAGIISVQRCYGSTHTITLTPHTEWVEVNFRELRSPSKKQRVSPTPAAPSHLVEDTNTTPNTPDTNTPATPSADTPPATNTTHTICTNVADTPATPSADTDTTPTPDTPATGGNGKKQLPILKQRVSPTPATNTPPATNGDPCPEHISLIFNNFKNGKKLRVSPTPDTPATNITDTPPTPTPAAPSADIDTTPNTPVTDTPPDTDT